MRYTFLLVAAAFIAGLGLNPNEAKAADVKEVSLIKKGEKEEKDYSVIVVQVQVVYDTEPSAEDKKDDNLALKWGSSPSMPRSDQDGSYFNSYTAITEEKDNKKAISQTFRLSGANIAMNGVKKIVLKESDKEKKTRIYEIEPRGSFCPSGDIDGAVRLIEQLAKKEMGIAKVKCLRDQGDADRDGIVTVAVSEAPASKPKTPMTK